MRFIEGIFSLVVALATMATLQTAKQPDGTLGAVAPPQPSSHCDRAAGGPEAIARPDIELPSRSAVPLQPLQRFAARGWKVAHPKATCQPACPSISAGLPTIDLAGKPTFAIGNAVYVLSAASDGRSTSLYLLDGCAAHGTQQLNHVDTFDLHGEAWSAASSADGRQLAIVASSGVWLFQRNESGQSFFAGRVLWGPSSELSLDSVCFADAQTLLVADSAAEKLWELQVKHLTELQAGS